MVDVPRVPDGHLAFDRMMAFAHQLAETLGTDEIEVNSMHHQAVKALAPGLRAVAWAPDQIVEGLELSDRSRFVLGVQWHPEELISYSEPARRLFTALVKTARA